MVSSRIGRKFRMKKTIAWASVAAALAAIVVVAILMRGAPADSHAGEEKKVRREKGSVRSKAVANAAHGETNAPASAARRKMRFRRISAADRTDLPEADRRLLVAIEKAVDENDFKALQAVVARGGASFANPEVRGDVVDAMGWFGKEALLDLLPFMADADEDISQSALDNWTSALADVENEIERSDYVVNAMKIITDKDALEAMIMQLDDCDDVVEMQALVDVIESKNKVAVEVAKEHYEFVTGEEYVDFDAANAWIAEHYVPNDEEVTNEEEE